MYADLDNNNRYDAATDRIATTDVAGFYAIQKLPNRTYVVRPLGQAGFRQTTAAGSYTVAVTRPAQVATQRNFGYTNRALVTGSVWLDPNRNRVRDRGEVGLGGGQVLLDRNNNARADAGEQSAWTDAAGNYAFRDALPGGYVIRVLTKPGFAATTTNGSALTLGTGQTVGGRTFGFRRL